jgi:hypothetical protein
MFKTTVPELIVNLPSAGKLEYPAEVKIRAITGREEMKMNSTNLIKYIDLVIKECAKDVVTNEPLDVDKLSSEDKVYLFIMLRSLSYGDSMTAGYRCNQCGTNNEVHLELSKLPIKQLDDDMLLNSTFTLPVSGVVVELRLLSDHEIYAIESEARTMEVKTKKPFKECRDLLIKTRRLKSITFEDSEKGLMTEENSPANRSIFQLLIENLIGKDLSYLDKKWVELNNYGIDLTVEHKCSGCGTTSPVGVDVTSTEFFRPSETE